MAAARKKPRKIREKAGFRPRQVASKVVDVTLGLRQLTRKRKPLEFLDYLLALVQREAEEMSVRDYH